MTTYTHGKVYKIVCNKTNEVYIGSTTQPLSKRLAQHRMSHKQYLNGLYGFISSFPILERGDYDIVLIENVSCENKEQLHRAERKHIEQNACVNRNIPLRTRREYYIDNLIELKEKQNKYDREHAEKKRIYYIENVERIKERMRNYYYEKQMFKRAEKL